MKASPLTESGGILLADLTSRGKARNTDEGKGKSGGRHEDDGGPEARG